MSPDTGPHVQAAATRQGKTRVGQPRSESGKEVAQRKGQTGTPRVRFANSVDPSLSPLPPAPVPAPPTLPMPSASPPAPPLAAPQVPRQPPRNYVIPPAPGGTRRDQPVQDKDMEKLLDHTFPIPLRMLLGFFPGSYWHRKSDLSRAGAEAVGHSVGTLLVENVSTEHVPELSFAPFYFAHQTPSGRYKHVPDQWLHFANVDSGAQISCIYQGVLDAFPSLLDYFVPHEHSVQGVGGITKVHGLLVDVPICLGNSPVSADRVVFTTFRCLDMPNYHIIFGRTFLEYIQATLDMGKEQKLTYVVPNGAQFTVSTVRTSAVKLSAVYREARNRIDNVAKVDVRGTACYDNLSTAVQFGPGSTAPPTPYLPDQLASLSSHVQLLQSNGPDLVDDSWVIEGLQGGVEWAPLLDIDDLEVPAWDCDTVASSWAVNTFAVMDTQELSSAVQRAAEVYHRRPPKGKPVPKEPRISHLKQTSGARVCLVGPRYVGVTSTLSQLGQHGYKIVHSAELPRTPHTFSMDHLSDLVTVWQSFHDDPSTILTDVSPWAYLRLHVLMLPPEEKSRARSLLGRLSPPDFHVLLFSSGAEVARRGAPLIDMDESVLGAQALLEMRDLSLLEGICYTVDCTIGGPEHIAARVDKLLRRTLLRVQQVAVPPLTTYLADSSSLQDLETWFTQLPLPVSCLSSAVAALHSSLVAGISPIPLRCPHCSEWHLDEGWHACHLHIAHTCAGCHMQFSSAIPAVGNPLALCNPMLTPSSLIALSRPSVSVVETAQFDGMDHLAGESGIRSVSEASEFLHSVGVTQEQGVDLLRGAQTLSIVLKVNPSSINPDLSSVDRQPYLQTLYRRHKAIAVSLLDLREPAKVPPFVIRTFGAPVHSPPHRMPESDLDALRVELGKCVEAGIVRPSTSPWSAPAMVVPKPGGKKRVVLDYRRLNAQTVRDSHPQPHPEDVCRVVGQYKYFVKIDLKSGFWQVPVVEDSIPKTGFSTPDGLFEWTRCPQGVRNGPPHFQRCSSQMIRSAGLQGQAGCFIDDLGTGGSTHALAASQLDQLLSGLEAHCFKAGADKFSLGHDAIPFLGFLIKEGRLLADPAKVDAIQRLVPPTTRAQLRSFLGIAGYYRQFIRNFAQIARPLYKLLAENTVWAWTSTTQSAFEELQAKLCSTPVLSLPVRDRPFVLLTDYSCASVSAILEQLAPDGKYHPVAYGSRCCVGAETKLCSSEGELLAVVFGVQKFHHFLSGARFKLVTDNSALQYLQDGKGKNPKLARWAMILANYDFVVQYKPGVQHSNADGLSRAAATPDPSTLPTSLAVVLPASVACCSSLTDSADLPLSIDLLEVSALQHPDPAPTPSLLGPRQLLLESAPCAKCRREVPANHGKTVLCDGCNAVFHLGCVGLAGVPSTYYYCSDCRRHIASRGIREPAEDVEFQRYLLGASSSSIDSGLQTFFSALAEQYRFVDNMLQRWVHNVWLPYPSPASRLLLLEQFHIQHCHIGPARLYSLLAQSYYWPNMLRSCHEYVRTCFPCQLDKAETSGFWSRALIPLPAGPRVEWSIDLVAVPSPNGKTHYILTAVCAFSRYLLLTHLPDKSSTATAAFLDSKLFPVFGPPLLIRTDNGKEFQGVFDQTCRAMGVKVIRNSVYYSRSNGLVERFNRTIETLLRRTLVGRPNGHWPALLSAVQLAVNTSAGRATGAPAYLIMFGSLPPMAQPNLPSLRNDPASLRLYANAADRHLSLIRTATRQHHDSYKQKPLPVAAPPPAIGIGSLVLVFRPRASKLLVRSSGPYLVLEVRNHTALLLNLATGVQFAEHLSNLTSLHLPDLLASSLPSRLR